ncbi:MAG: TIGR02679 family protein [Acidimicrobiales bacterium]
MSQHLLDGAFAPLWAAARRRLEANGLSLEGTPLVLKGLAPESSDSIAGLLGARRPTNGTLRVSLAKLDLALRSSVVGRGLLEVLADVGGPLVDRRVENARLDAGRSRQWAELARHAAVELDPRLGSWLDRVRSSGLARRLARDEEASVLSSALDTLVAISRGDGARRLAVLAAEVTGDAHGLDRGNPVGTLTVHALTYLAGEQFPRDAADWRRVWNEAGVACDDLSCDVLVLALPGWPAEPLRLTLRQVSSWRPPSRVDRTVFVSENPAIVAAAADHFDERPPMMVCLDGMPSTAALMVLDELATAGSAVVYHGDFDWRGLAIAGVLARKVPIAESWRFSAADYHAAVDRGLGAVALTGRASVSPWDNQLAPAMERAGVAIYEEQVVLDLLDDLSSVARPPRVSP